MLSLFVVCLRTRLAIFVLCLLVGSLLIGLCLSVCQYVCMFVFCHYGRLLFADILLRIVCYIVCVHHCYSSCACGTLLICSQECV